MTDALFEGDDAANTPLTIEERDDLIPSNITLRYELNEAEQLNIAEAFRWATSRKKRDVLDRPILNEIHRTPAPAARVLLGKCESR